MKSTRKINRLFQGQLAAAWLLAAINSQLFTARVLGVPTQPGAPGTTTSDPRTPISSAPFTVSVPGSYYLTENLTVKTGNAITIATNGVTLDLNGFTISSTAASAAGCGILLSNTLSDITIVNGHIRSGVTNNSSGIYSGSGFAFGICYSGNAPTNVVITKVSVAGGNDGIYLGNGNGTVVEACTVTTAGNTGICASSIKNSVATDCGFMAIYGDQVADCEGISIMDWGISAYTVLNCYGYSSMGDGGISAYTAMNCFGFAGGSGSPGIFAYAAMNCYGWSYKSVGLRATTALNCYGYSLYSIGLSSDMANSCYGEGVTGLSAYCANFCFGNGATPVSVTYKYNMP